MHLVMDQMDIRCDKCTVQERLITDTITHGVNSEKMFARCKELGLELTLETCIAFKQSEAFTMWQVTKVGKMSATIMTQTNMNKLKAKVKQGAQKTPGKSGNCAVNPKPK